MKLVHTISHVAEIPEILVFYCAHCQHAETLMPEPEEQKVA
jgi:hypothetical protein